MRTRQTRIAPRSPKKLNVSTAAMHPSLPKRVNLDQVTRFCLPFNFRFAPKATVSDRSAACRDRPLNETARAVERYAQGGGWG